MAGRQAASQPQASRALVAAIFLLIALALLPASLQRWVGWLGEIAELVASPIQHPIARLARNLRPAPDAVTPGGPGAEKLKEENEFLKSRLAQRDIELKNLQNLVAELQRARSLNPDIPVRLIPAAVIGQGADLGAGMLKVRAGSVQGVIPGAVATVQGVQIVGRVVTPVQARTCYVHCITHGSEPIEAAIWLDDLSRGPACTLRPTGDGALSGDVEHLAASVEQPELRPGMTVRLADASWPRDANGFVIGLIESVEPKPQQPLRRTIVVRPTVRPERASEVMLRTAGDPDAGGAP